MVRPATLTAVSASISTPVLLVVRTVAVIATPGRSSRSSQRTSMWLSGSGWQSGISSAVRLAAITPAICATVSTSPFLIWPARMSARVSGRIMTSPAATATRSVSGLWPTSTMWALPAASRCVRAIVDQFTVLHRLCFVLAWPRRRLHGQIERAVLYLVINAAQVLADDAQENELHAAQEEHRDERGGLSGKEQRLIERAQHGDNGDGHQRRGRHPKAQRGGQLERHIREAGDGIGGQLEHLAERILGGASVTLLALIADAGLAKANPGREPAHEAMVLTHLPHGQHHLAVNQPEVAGVGRNVNRRQTANDAVEHGRGEQLEPGFADAHRPLRIDHLVALVPLFDQLVDHLRRVLQVGVDNDDRVALGVVNAGRDGDLVAKIAGKLDDFDARVALAQFGGNLG